MKKANKTRNIGPMLERKPLTKEEKKKEMKKNLITYGGSAILISSLFLGGISIAEATTDHTKEKCPITHIGQMYIENSKCGLTLGDCHQMNAMREEYKEKGKDVSVVYDPYYRYATAYVNIPVDVISVKKPDGTTVYTAPSNATIVRGSGEDMKAYVSKVYKSNVEPAYVVYENIEGTQVEIRHLKKR